jgi:hypothetical protein
MIHKLLFWITKNIPLGLRSFAIKTKKFVPGDRVAIYNYYKFAPDYGTIVAIDKRGMLWVKLDTGQQWYWHPKQCRKSDI